MPSDTYGHAEAMRDLEGLAWTGTVENDEAHHRLFAYIATLEARTPSDDAVQEATRSITAVVNAWDAESPSASHQRDLDTITTALTDAQNRACPWDDGTRGMSIIDCGRLQREAADLRARVERLENGLRDVRKHHEAINGRIGRGIEMSATLRIVDDALAPQTAGDCDE